MRAIPVDWQFASAGALPKRSAIPPVSIMAFATGLPVALAALGGVPSAGTRREMDMRHAQALKATVALAALGCAMPANADILDFTGDLTARAVVTADPACSPSFRGVITPSATVGNSSLGAFTYGHTVCTAGAVGGPVTGSFTLDFGGDGFFGTLAGTATPTATPPIADLSFLFTILGGTGRFLDASGTFTGIGTADPRVFPSTVRLNFDGAINAPAVPEPGTWAMLILGFGMIGWSLRYRSARRAFA